MKITVEVEVPDHDYECAPEDCSFLVPKDPDGGKYCRLFKTSNGFGGDDWCCLECSEARKKAKESERVK